MDWFIEVEDAYIKEWILIHTNSEINYWAHYECFHYITAASWTVDSTHKALVF